MSTRESDTAHYTPADGTTELTPALRPRMYFGPDHLLCMRLHGAGELARRFRYVDITGVRCVETRLHWAYGGAFLVALLLAMLLLAWARPAGPIILVFALVILACAAGLYANVVKGPTCRAWLHTADHTEPLPALRRYRSARRALAEIHARVEEARADAGRVGEAVEGLHFTPPPARLVPRPIPPLPGGAGMMRAAFVLAALLGISLVFDFAYNIGWKNALDSLILLVLAILAPISFVQARRVNAPGRVRFAALSLLVFAASFMPQVIIMMTLAMLATPSILAENPDMLGHPANFSPSDGPVFFILHGFNAFFVLILVACGVAGLAGGITAQRPGHLAEPDANNA
ncbi:MAG: hypothetical protein KF886_01340 [Candidatus Hydrogenedentes bacterium]|nr:hypothetical protein [Candidatus Hydrogenedentota bacterium]